MRKTKKIKKKSSSANGQLASPMRLRKTFSMKLSSDLSRSIGSWAFIMMQSGLIIVWLFFTLVVFDSGWDSPSFVILNLLLSIVAAFSAPVILMSQNIESEKDRVRAINDLATDRRSERGILKVQQQLEQLEQKISELKGHR